MIQVEDLSVRVGTFSLEGISFRVETGRYAVLMGKTGCGKTTLIECICGLRRASGGRILLDDQDVTTLKPAERGIGFVPQDTALFMTMTVREHLAFALAIRNASRKEQASRAEELGRLLAIDHLMDRRPEGLSGGEAKRVALGRALCANPRILCLDEPLAALDHDTRAEMCVVLDAARKEFGITTLHITHSLDEAVQLADVILLFEDGRIVTTPQGVSASP